MDLVGADPSSTWMLAEGGDGSAVARSIPLTDEIIAEGMLAMARMVSRCDPHTAFPCGCSCRASKAI
jgi:sulfane dehydrogenase subunit SoxC